MINSRSTWSTKWNFVSKKVIYSLWVLRFYRQSDIFGGTERIHVWYIPILFLLCALPSTVNKTMFQISTLTPRNTLETRDMCMHLLQHMHTHTHFLRITASLGNIRGMRHWNVWDICAEKREAEDLQGEQRPDHTPPPIITLCPRRHRKSAQNNRRFWLKAVRTHSKFQKWPGNLAAEWR